MSVKKIIHYSEKNLYISIFLGVNFFLGLRFS